MRPNPRSGVRTGIDGSAGGRGLAGIVDGEIGVFWAWQRSRAQAALASGRHRVRKTNTWPDPMFEGEGEHLDSAEADRAIGNEFGKRMAQVMRLPPPAKGHALLISDDDVRMSAAWRATCRCEIRRTRRRAEIRMAEASPWATGRSEPGDVRTDAYCFELKPSPHSVNRSVRALAGNRPPTALETPFQPALGATAIAAAAALDRLGGGAAPARGGTGRRRRRRLERERLRIAQDIHDDLGASPTPLESLEPNRPGRDRRWRRGRTPSASAA